MFPDIKPFADGRLQVSDLHAIYWEQCGRSDGPAFLFLHGGPGAGCTERDRQFFDPGHWRIVLFDQRGAGRSTPQGEIHDNTPDALVADIERLREELGIEQWHVFGGSWGSTLALYYAQQHPSRVLGLVLRGIFLMRECEVEWWLYGMGKLFPESWRTFAEFVPPLERNDLMEAYYRRLFSGSPEEQLAAAKSWSRYEGSCCTLLPNPEFVEKLSRDDVALGVARLEAHYMRDCLFSPDDRLLAEVDRIRDIPAAIVQGRYDVVCPAVTADELHRRWPEAEYVIVEDAGHSSWEPGIARELVAATERMKQTSPLPE